ncbi:MAG TPA: ATP-binding protein [Dehalococcoidales bacterium]
MKIREDTIEAQYLACFSEYLNGTEESALACAYEIGRQANAGGIGILEFLAIHHRVLETVINQQQNKADILRTTRIAHYLFSESLASFEMVNRGFRENLEELVRSNKELEKEIAERRKLEESLRKYAVDLEAANKDLESFSYSVAHDLRAPLRGMSGFSSALLEDYADKLDEQGKEYLNNIRQSSKQMAQLIDDLLKVARVGRVELSIDKINLSDMVGSIAGELKLLEPERQAEFIVSPDINASGDPNLVVILLRNLLDNAWKFTAKCAGTRIEFGVSPQGSTAVYYVKDNGVGFDAQYSNKLFKPFNRLHSEAEYPGTGIGLAIVQSIVRRHGGRVWAEGSIGKGATFYFTLTH